MRGRLALVALSMAGLLLLGELSPTSGRTATIQAAARGHVQVTETNYLPVKVLGHDITITTESGLTGEMAGDYCVDGSCSADSSCGA